MKFSTLLTNLRKSIGLTQVQASKLMSVSPRTYWEWEKGTNEPVLIMQRGALAALRDLQPKEREAK